ncbi:MAG: 50S ribosomal protein L11 methyltransferase [Candidatus Omnitrophica bacterium]|nr:50S ribosomal protein L11 methyltransferase [Candidatus Omnitrophota bacterium]
MDGQIGLIPASTFSGYNGLFYHKGLLNDRVRTDYFRRAIKAVVPEGSVVADLGAGSGILSFFALQAGAKRVYAIENENIIKVARKVAQRNKMRRRIIFINRNSRTASLPEKVDVVVSECLSHFAVCGGMVSELAHFRDKYLKPGGIVVPRGIRMYLAPVESGKYFREVQFWRGNKYGIDFSCAQEFSNNNVYIVSLGPGNLLATARAAAEIDLLAGYPDEMLSVNTDFTASRSGRLHGLLGWFDVTLSDGICLDTLRAEGLRSWQQVFFPLDKEIRARKGERISARLSLKRADDETCFCFEWAVSGRGFSESHSTRKSFPSYSQEKCRHKTCRQQADGKERNAGLEDMVRKAEKNQGYLNIIERRLLCA